jgi:predicted nucleotidyltransferase
MILKGHKRVRKIIEAVRKDPDVLALLLYGSVARGNNSSFSDTDLCVVLVPAARTALDLSRKKLEYAANFPTHLSIFQQIPIYVRQRILREGRVLFCRDTDALYEVAFATIREFTDFDPIYREYLREVANGG